MTIRPTEQRNPRTLDIDTLPSADIVRAIMAEDARAIAASSAIAASVGELVDRSLGRYLSGGRIHYFGAGASGRLALLDATEAMPTFGVPAGVFVAHFPGGAPAVIDSALDFEDSGALGERDAADVAAEDVAMGITASGTTAYVLGALDRARSAGALTALVTCDPSMRDSDVADIVMVADTGPEAITGSTRLKAGTATKSMLNAFSTTLLVRAGRTYSNLMVDMVVTNAKLRDRAVTIMEMATGSPRRACADMLDACEGELPVALTALLSGSGPDSSRGALAIAGSVRRAVDLIGRG